MDTRRLAAAVLLVASPLFGQAVTEWTTVSGLAVAVVEVGGGDVEHIAALLPADATPPITLAGFPVRTESGRGGLAASFTVPVLLAPQAVEELAGGLAGSGAAAVVVLGPVAARELAGALAVLDRVPVHAVPRRPCRLAEGGIEVRRDSSEGIELRLAAPGPDDPRFDLLPIFTAWLEARLRPSFPGLGARSEMDGACSQLVLRSPSAEGERPRSTLKRLREALEALAGGVPTTAELETMTATARRTLAAVARDGAEWAVALAERRALGGEVASALALPDPEPAALEALAGAVLRGHPGLATVREAERRAVAGTPELLDNGAVLSWRWVPGETGAAAVALGGLDPAVGRALLEGAAASAATQGWAAELVELFGVPTLAVASPSEELPDVLEQLAESVQGAPAAQSGGLDADIAHALGLGQQPRADALSIALALAPGADEGREAAEKFFAAVAAAPVRSTAAFPVHGLAWTRDGATPEVAALVELPAGEAGLVAGVVLEQRLRREEGVSVRWLVPPTRLVLEVRGSGGAHVPALEERLGAIWKSARRRVDAGELQAATRELAGRLLGDCVRATARAAASPFLPSLPTAEVLLATEPAEIDAVLAALPAWDGLPRVARGPAPLLATPPGRGTVRKSPSAKRPRG